MKSILITAILTFTFTAFAIHAVESTVFSAAGIIESTTGGVKFPDGSVQASAAFPAASTCTAITYIPYTIIYEGVYCFTEHLSYSVTSGNAITINADNVTINMNGWKLDGLAAGTGTTAYGIYAYQRKNITIRNGSIRGFRRGIYLEDASPYTTSSVHLVEDVLVDGSTQIGIMVKGQGCRVRNNQVVDTGGALASLHMFGIVVYGPSAMVLNNEVAGTTGKLTFSAYGIYLFDADSSVVAGNRVTDTTYVTGSSSGIHFNSSDFVTARDNTVTTANNGIYYVSSSGKYMGNLTSNVTVPFFGGTAVGIND